MTERQIEFSEIKVGDRIRVESTYNDLKLTAEGVAHRLSEDTNIWWTEEGAYLGEKDRPNGEADTFYLIPRELPTQPGSVIIATEVRHQQGEWTLFLDEDFEWLSAVAIEESTWHQPEHITAWKPAKVVVT